jgi:hypothetical protein
MINHDKHMINQSPYDHLLMVKSPLNGEIRIKIGDLNGQIIYTWICLIFQWEFQDPKMEVLYHIRPYFVVIFTYIGHI